MSKKNKPNEQKVIRGFDFFFMFVSQQLVVFTNALSIIARGFANYMKELLSMANGFVPSFLDPASLLHLPPGIFSFFDAF